MAARRQVANSAINDDDIHAKYKHNDRMFIHGVHLGGSKPFMLKEVIFTATNALFIEATDECKFTLTSGPYAGLKGYVAVPATHFPFERLPVELRQRVYEILFPVKHVVTIDLCRTDGYSGFGAEFSSYRYRGPRKTSMLSVNRAISAEIIDYLYRPTHFMSSSMANLNKWLATIGSCRQHLTRLTIFKSGHTMTSTCYTLLADAVRLQSFEITLPGSLRATLDEHIERHWDSLKNYLLAPGTDRTESLRRLDTVRLKIGPSQNGILNSEGDSMREMTAARHDWCKTKIRGKVLEHFMRKTMEQKARIQKHAETEKKATAQLVKHEKTDSSVRSKVKVMRPLPVKRRLPAPVIVIDDDTDE